MQSKEKHHCVEKVPYFNHLNEDEMLKIVGMSTHRHYKKGDVIFAEGDTLDYLYIVHVGNVKIYQLFASGKEQLLRILTPGDFMGEHALFSEKVLDSYAEAMSDTQICAIHRKDMQQLMQSYPTIAVKILEEFSTRLDQSEKLIGQLSTNDVETRIASYLMDKVSTEETKIVKLPITKKDLASYLGTTQETISRRLAKLEMKGVIQQEGQRHIHILNMNMLSDIASGIGV